MKSLIIIFCVFTFTACDIFTTRDAEEPNTSRSNYKPATEPAIVIENLINSFSDKNVQNYLACFVDTIFSSKIYNYDPSSEAASTYLFLVQDWDLNGERRYFNSMVSKVPTDFPISLTFSDENYGSLSGDTLVYTANYFLNVPHNSSEPQNYSGNLQFNMARDSRAEWVVYYWKDTKSSSLPSWSELKGLFY